MVGKMHETMDDRPAEETRLDQAMTSMDPILQASLKREQQRRVRKKILYGGSAMALIIAVLSVVLFSSPGTVPGEDTNRKEETKEKTKEKDAVKTVADAEELVAEGWRDLQSGSAGAAEDKFRLAAEADPENPHTWNSLGWSQFHQQKFDEAIESFRKCLKLEPKHAGALNGLGQTYFAKREYDLAEPYMRRSSAKGAPAADFGLAKLYLLQGKFDKAKAMLAKVRKGGIGELKPDLFKDMEDAAEKQVLSDELRSLLEPREQTAAETDDSEDGKSAVDRNAEGWRHFQTGKNRAAEVAFRAALKKAPDMQAAQNGLGFALLNQGKPKEARPIFEKLVKAQPRHGGYVNGLARCHAETGDHEKAITVWKTQEKGKGPITASTWGLARSLVALERFDEALPVLKRIKAGSDRDAGVNELIERCKAAE